MTVRSVRRYPDPILNTRCGRVSEITPETRRLVEDMRDTMIAENGAGISAPQVGLSLRIFLVDIWWPTNEFDKTLVFVNPELTELSGYQRVQEGCLSLPNIRESVSRAERVHVQAVGLDGRFFELDADGYLAVAIQHENDHLNGMTILDRMGILAKKLAIRSLVRSSAV